MNDAKTATPLATDATDATTDTTVPEESWKSHPQYQEFQSRFEVLLDGSGLRGSDREPKFREFVLNEWNRACLHAETGNRPDQTDPEKWTAVVTTWTAAVQDKIEKLKTPAAAPAAAARLTPPPPARRPAPPAPAPRGGLTARAPGMRRASQAARHAAPRIVINAVEGHGKTTLGAHAPNPGILMSRGETGYDTLFEAGLVPDCDAAEIQTWPELLAQIDAFIKTPPGYGTLVLDALGGFERLCHEHVCREQFEGNWGEKGFGSFQKGYDVSVSEWLILLQKLDRLRMEQNMAILFLSHVQVRPFKNPLGPDFDRYVADCHPKTWGVTHKWADAVLFGNFVTVVVEDKRTKRPKGRGGSDRILYTERTDAYDAKNRYGMPPVIYLPNDPAQSWNTVASAISSAADPAAEDSAA